MLEVEKYLVQLKFAYLFIQMTYIVHYKLVFLNVELTDIIFDRLQNILRKLKNYEISQTYHTN